MNKLKNIVIFLFLNALAWTSVDSHFAPAWYGEDEGQTLNPFNRHQINVSSAILGDLDLESGDEIGIYDGEMCVGVGVADGTIAPNHILSIKASAANGDIPGFITDNPIIYRYWDESAQMEIVDIGAIYALGPETFAQLADSYVELTGVSIEDIFGCTDSSACNHDADANVDDGSCEYEIDCNDVCGGSSKKMNVVCVMEMALQMVHAIVKVM